MYLRREIASRFLFSDWDEIPEDFTPTDRGDRKKKLPRPAKVISKRAQVAVMEVREALGQRLRHPQDLWRQEGLFDQIGEQASRHSKSTASGEGLTATTEHLPLLMKVQEEEAKWLDAAKAVRLMVRLLRLAASLRRAADGGRHPAIKKALDQAVKEMTDIVDRAGAGIYL